MPAARSFDYAVLRIVPRVERGEFVNAGVVLFSSECDYLDARVRLDRERVLGLFPDADLAAIEEHLLAVPRICAGGAAGGPIGQLSKRERWHWLVAPRSTVLQVSPVHSGISDEPARALDELMERMVLPGGAAEPGRER